MNSDVIHYFQNPTEWYWQWWWYRPDRGDVTCRTADGAGCWLAADGCCSFLYCRFARASIIWSMLERGSGVGKPSITSCWPAVERRVCSFMLWDSLYCTYPLAYTNFMLTNVPWWCNTQLILQPQLQSLHLSTPSPLSFSDDCRFLTQAWQPTLVSVRLSQEYPSEILF